MHQYSLTKNNDILKLTSLFIIKLLHFTHLGQLFIIWLLNMQLPDTASPTISCLNGILRAYFLYIGRTNWIVMIIFIVSHTLPHKKIKY